MRRSSFSLHFYLFFTLIFFCITTNSWALPGPVSYARGGENGYSGLITLAETHTPLAIVLPDALPPGSYQVEFYTVHGQLAARYHVDLSSAQKRINVDLSRYSGSLARGVYFYRIGPPETPSPFQSPPELFFRDISQTHLPGDSLAAAFCEFGDLTGDSLPDIFLGINTSSSPVQPQVFINTGDGHYENQTTQRLPQLPFLANDVLIIDVDHDGDNDVYLAGDHGTPGLQGKDRLWLNDGQGHFSDATATHLPALPGISTNVGWGDLNGDSYPDLVVTHLGMDANTPLVVLLNDGSGHFSDASGLLPATQYNAFDAVITDLNGDTLPDIVLACLGDRVITGANGNPVDTLSGRNAALIQTPAGQFVDETAQRLPDINRWSKLMKVADLNNDQRPELYSINIGFGAAEAANVLYWNDGSGVFSDETASRLPAETVLWNNDAELTDFQGDRQIDIFMINVIPGGPADDVLYFNDGGFFSDQSQHLPPILDFNASCTSADVDQDTDADIFISVAGANIGERRPDLLYENIISLVAVDPFPSPAKTYTLEQNYPNPFNPSTILEFGLQNADWAKLKVYDLLGREVKTLVNERLAAGTHRVEWDGRDNAGRPVASGVYIYQLHAGNFTQTRKMVLLR